ncbi:c(7)-type cytochrome triheme domain-containing protein [Anaeromyxobacter oryzae]|uniref:Cytochrome c7-like domain-containing protein n=1 Tax=Anaeromyxobacter oryzae TaxID=2918170 RepID=A0ABM7WU14_9BACT|nr:c(7)-type cytochrome triheme domain-containing protein [Anaeromyxobacter oryzae]BDG02991.1 hypothetical protein AMOR_19870 [Anaeromyxobacter oryzae]
MTSSHGGSRWITAALGLLAAAAVAAKELPALPQDLALARTGDSPGQVTFRHVSHVDADKASCVSCHPRLFSVLGRSSEKRAPAVTHARMEKGEACGACHGKKAFGFDDCTACHAQ